MSWKKATLLVWMAVSSACALAAEVAGSVSFVIGEAGVIGEDGRLRAVARGENINAGQVLQTGATGHIHLRMVDGAFVSIRPQSRFRIEEYRYDPVAPANNRIKFALEKGVARSITGRAGEMSKETYRLNTPLAAIGIRGTDFVVQAASDITRVTVQSGAVVMAPLTGECLASALGPCTSASSRVLTAAMRDAYLELRSRNEAPLLVPAEKALDSPNLLAPPRPEEPRLSNDKQAKTTPNVDSRDAVRDVAVDTIKTKVDAAMPANAPAAPTTTPEPVNVVVTPPPAAKFWWGRWSSYMQPGQQEGSFIAALAPGREISVGNSVFGLLRETGNVVLPNSGVAKFQLAESEAYFMAKDQKTLTSAQISSPSLTVDFAARRYDTALHVNGENSVSVPVQASGKVTFQGQLVMDVNNTGTEVHGALSRHADQAGYVFQRKLPDGGSVIGATRWLR